MMMFVTGGSRGIGRAIVLNGIREGHDVAFTYVRNAGLAREVEQEACALRPGARCRAHQLDVRQAADVERVSEAVLEDVESVDVVVCNAGTNRDNLLVSMSDDEWHDVIATRELWSVVRDAQCSVAAATSFASGSSQRAASFSWPAGVG